MKAKKYLGYILKLDLVKAYDRIDWTFLCLILLQIGIARGVVSWIMACVSDVHFAILINSEPTGFFQGNRGLRKGCPFWPLLFLMVMDGLSRMINDAILRGLLEGIRFTRERSITHILFVDDILIFGNNTYL